MTTIEEFRAALRGNLRKDNGDRYTAEEVLGAYLAVVSPVGTLARKLAGVETKPDGERYTITEILADLLGACEEMERDAAKEGLVLFQRAAAGDFLTMSNAIPGGLRGLLARVDSESGTHRINVPGRAHPYDPGFWCGSFYGSVAAGDDPSLVSCDACRATYGPVVDSAEVLALLKAEDHDCYYTSLIRALCGGRRVVPVNILRAVLVEFFHQRDAGRYGGLGDLRGLPRQLGAGQEDVLRLQVAVHHALQVRRVQRDCGTLERIGLYLDTTAAAPAEYRGPAAVAKLQAQLPPAAVAKLVELATAADSRALAGGPQSNDGRPLGFRAVEVEEGAGAGVAVHLVPAAEPAKLEG